MPEADKVAGAEKEGRPGGTASGRNNAQPLPRDAREESGHHQHGHAHRRMIDQRVTQRAPPRHGRKNRAPRGAVRASRMIVERFRQLAAALREEQAGAVQRIGGLVERCDGLLQARLARNHCSAGRALRGVRIQCGARSASSSSSQAYRTARDSMSSQRTGRTGSCGEPERTISPSLFVASEDKFVCSESFVCSELKPDWLKPVPLSGCEFCCRSLTAALPIALAACASRGIVNSSRFPPWCRVRRRYRAASGPGNASSQKPCAREASRDRARLEIRRPISRPLMRRSGSDERPLILLPVEEIAGHGIAIRVRRKLRRLVFRAAASPAQMIEADVGDDAVRPGIKAALEAEARQILVNFEEMLPGRRRGHLRSCAECSARFAGHRGRSGGRVLQTLRGRRPARVRSGRVLPTGARLRPATPRTTPRAGEPPTGSPEPLPDQAIVISSAAIVRLA